MSVNVSPVQLAHPSFVNVVIAALEQARLDPEGLILEITETAMMSRWNEARAKLQQLRSIGVAIALDDFGTGYSSLSSLHLLPVDYVKIDKSFTQRIGNEAGSAVVLDSIIGMAHHLGFRVVAEGVETPMQQNSLNGSRCDLLQGFLLGRPLSAPQTSTLLESTHAVCV